MASNKNMDPSLRIATQLPLHTLWDAAGPIGATRLGHVSLEEIRELLRAGAVQFVLADVGAPLNWIPLERGFDFFKTELASHLADPARIVPDNYPDGRAFVASRWHAATRPPIVLLEVHH